MENYRTVLSNDMCIINFVIDLETSFVAVSNGNIGTSYGYLPDIFENNSIYLKHGTNISYLYIIGK